MILFCGFLIFNMFFTYIVIQILLRGNFLLDLLFNSIIFWSNLSYFFSNDLLGLSIFTAQFNSFYLNIFSIFFMLFERFSWFLILIMLIGLFLTHLLIQVLNIIEITCKNLL